MAEVSAANPKDILSGSPTSYFNPAAPTWGQMVDSNATSAQRKAGLTQHFDPTGLVQRALNRRSSNRKADNAAKLELLLYMMRTRQAANRAKKAYQEGNITEGQQASIDQFKRQNQQELMRALYGRGLTEDSSVAVNELGRIDLGAVGMKDQMLDEEFKKYMQALGLTKEASDTIRQMNTDDRQEAIGVYQGFMSVLGGMGAYGNKNQNTGIPTQSQTPTGQKNTGLFNSRDDGRTVTDYEDIG